MPAPRKPIIARQNRMLPQLAGAAAAGALLAWGASSGGLGWLASGLGIAALAWQLSSAWKFESRRADSADEVCAGLSMRQIAESCFGIEAILDSSGRLCWISPSIERVTGVSERACLAAEDLIGLLVHEPDRAYARTECDKVLAGTTGYFEIRLEQRTGRVVWIACNWRSVRDTDGRLVAVRLSADDIQSRRDTELKQLEALADAQRARALSEHYLVRSKDERQRLSAVLNTIRLGILLIDTDRRVQYFNQNFLAMWGFDPGENLFGMRDATLFARCEPFFEDATAYRQHLADLLEPHRLDAPFEYRLKDGRVLTESAAVIMREGRDEAIGQLWILEDVTEIRRNADLLIGLAERDPLTGLYNRRRFEEDIERVLGEANRRGRQFGLLVFDLDGFKPINDTYGHQAGDQVLMRLAEEVGRVIRRHEMLFRLGGDEFAILVPDSESFSLEELARRVVESVAQTRFSFGGRSIALTVSVGLACYPQHADSVEALVAAADEAMYSAKAAGRNRWVIHGASDA